MSKNIGSVVYDGMASVGRTKSIMNLVCLGIIGILMLICSYYLFTHPSNNVDGTAIASSDSTCNLLNNTNTCTTQILYTINNKPFTGFIIDNIPHTKGSTVNISYDPSNPANVVARQLPSSMVAIGLCVLGCCLIGGGYFNYTMTSNSQAYAAMEGTRAILHRFKN